MSGLSLWVCSLAVVVALISGITQVGAAGISEAKASTAADAAALAGAAAGPEAARKTALRNGGTVVSITTQGNVTTVVVQLGRSTATAHAKRIVVPVS